MDGQYNERILRIINKTLSLNFPDYRGAYLYGSRLRCDCAPDSDFDVVLLFDRIDFEKKLLIAGVIGDIEYDQDIFIDYKLFTTSGEKSIEHIRSLVNPFFIREAIDKGVFYGRQ